MYVHKYLCKYFNKTYFECLFFLFIGALNTKSGFKLCLLIVHSALLYENEKYKNINKKMTIEGMTNSIKNT